LSFCAFHGLSQSNNAIIGIYGGGGVATSNNYDVAIAGGLNIEKGIFYRTFLGLNLFYQQYSILFDNEANSSTGHNGQAGVMLYNKSSYIFLAPKFSVGIRNSQNVKFYCTAGVGYNMSGTETLQKWDFRYGSAPGSYDSTINTTPNINKLVFRAGIGLTEYLKMRGKWWLTFTEDFGFLLTNLSSTANPGDPSRTSYSPHNLNPAILSLQIGFAHTKY